MDAISHKEQPDRCRNHDCYNSNIAGIDGDGDYCNACILDTEKYYAECKRLREGKGPKKHYKTIIYNYFKKIHEEKRRQRRKCMILMNKYGYFSFGVTLPTDLRNIINNLCEVEKEDLVIYFNCNILDNIVIRWDYL